MEPISYVPPAEYEEHYHRAQGRLPGRGTQLTQPPENPGRLSAIPPAIPAALF